jgi:hypothetical protein
MFLERIVIVAIIFLCARVHAEWMRVPGAGIGGTSAK